MSRSRLVNDLVDTLLIGHGKLGEKGILECGAKDVCDVIKNIFAIGTLLISCITILIVPVGELTSGRLFYFVFFGTIATTLMLIVLFIQLFIVINKIPILQRISSRAQSALIFIFIALGILIGFFSLSTVAILAIAN